MSLRLHAWSAREIFYTSYLPVIDSGDEILRKFVRAKHEIETGASKSAHHIKKTTQQNLMRGEVGLIWYKKRAHVNTHVGSVTSLKQIKGLHPWERCLFE